LVAAARGDTAALDALVARRLEGEPLEWLIGHATFLGHRVALSAGVYVPRPQTEPIARRAIELLPPEGTAADLCTGSGAIAVALRAGRPRARVVATDIDPAACRCAERNGVEVYQGHLTAPLPTDLAGQYDVVVAVAPYVPTEQIAFLPRDVRRYEPRRALDGGADGTEVVSQVVRAATGLLRGGGSLLLELGGDEDRLLAPVLRAAGFATVSRFVDDDGDMRGIEAVFG